MEENIMGKSMLQPQHTCKCGTVVARGEECPNGCDIPWDPKAIAGGSVRFEMDGKPANAQTTYQAVPVRYE